MKPSGTIVIRERTESGHFSPSRPKIDLPKVSEELRAVGFTVLAPATDPSDRSTTLITATK